MRVLNHIRFLPKRGSTPEEYEDAFYPKYGGEHETKSFKFAVADGATETSFSGLWARMLVSAYCQGRFAPKKLWRNIERHRQQWLKTVKSKQLTWYAEEKLQLGAYSSLLGLTVCAPVENSDVARWKALAIGDSCLFQIRDGSLVQKWPLERSDQFGYHPILLSTKGAPDEESSEKRKQGEWSTGDVFYLMTDAIAQWYLKMVEQGTSPSEAIPNFGLEDSSQEFSDWIENLRDSGQMRNDDVTLMSVFLT